MDIAASCSRSSAAVAEHESDTEDSQSDSSTDEDEEEDDRVHRNKARIRINMESIPCVQDQDQDLMGLGVTAYDQNDYEEGVMRQIDHALESDPVENRKDTATAPTATQSLLTDFRELSAVPPSSTSAESSSKASISRKEVVRVEEDDDDDDDDEKEDEYRPETETESDDDIDQLEEGDSEFLPSDEEIESKKKRKKRPQKSPSVAVQKKQKGRSRVPYYDSDSLTTSKASDKSFTRTKVKDDGDEKYYARRMKCLLSSQIHPSFTAVEQVTDTLRVPTRIWSSLFPHQQSCIRWMYELHQSCIGGIIGDEMGLGKTIQVIAFFAGLKCSDNSSNFRESFQSLGPCIIVCPATVMHQWVSEVHKWYPYFRVAILHSSGSYSGGKSSLIRRVHKSNGILIMTYSCVKDYQNDLSDFDWHYVVLDEGHKIRNPDAQVTLACKRFRTPHRIILSGSPIQNNLKELWSLFDFIIPGKLGTLPVFMEQFSIPITQGGYANASDVQVKIAFRCATVLRDTIKPYLLRRMKDDVKDAIRLPKKNEQVLFCKLTDEQRTLYKEYLQSPDIADILKGSHQMFVGLINLRKICNHPDLFQGYQKDKVRMSGGGPGRKSVTLNVENDMSVMEYFTRSGKMLVVDALLKSWHGQGHKVLLFSQGTQMMSILEKYLILKEYTFIKLDGRTTIGMRQPLIHRFNHEADVFIFLLTTRVGGIGVNLTGATRVLIYDPDWNPSTDMQARERAWRIGQESSVTIYRLLTAGTIEEKIYHRQVFKQYLTNRVLKDPKQRRFFKTNDLYELFTLGNQEEGGCTESSAIFAGTGSEVRIPDRVRESERRKKKKDKRNKRKRHQEVETVSESVLTLSDERKQQLRERAKQLSNLLAQKFNNNSNNTSIGEACAPSSSSSSCPAPVASQKSVGREQDKRKDKSSKKKKKNKHRKSSAIVIDGQEIPHLVKQDSYRTSSTSGDQEDSSKQDDYVLSQLFKSSKGVIHSALQHDVIEGADATDYTLIEAEAEKVANDAISALQRSRRECFPASSGIPTWTGASGHLKKSTKPTFGSSASTSLLTAIKSRTRLLEDNMIDHDDDRERSGASSSSSTRVPDDPSAEHEEMLSDLRSFVSFQGQRSGEVTTEEVLSKFGSRIPAHQTPVFKAFLWKVCDFHRRSADGTGVWRLKQQFSS